MGDLSGLSVAELADGICLRAGRIAAAEAELLLWVGEFDRREGWAGTGLLSCAHWLLHHPAQPWGDPAALTDKDVSAGTLPPEHVEPRLDLRYAVSVLMSQAA